MKPRIPVAFWVLVFLGMGVVQGCSGESDSKLQEIVSDDASDTSEIQDIVGPEIASEVIPDSAEELEELVPEVVEPGCLTPVPTRIVDNNPDETFDLGPYLMVPTPTSIVIKWRTLEEEEGAVLFGKEGTDEFEVLEGKASLIHAVLLEGLEPDTRYIYQVRSGERTSLEHHFYTAPKPGGSFQFAAWGDNQGGTPFFDVVDAVTADNPHVIIGLGDHVPNGQVVEHWKDHWFGPARALFHEVPLFAAIGNHAYNGPTWYDLMEYQKLSVNPNEETVYSWTYGNAFFLVVDTNGLFFDVGNMETDWSKWIKKELESPEAKAATWRIAYAHEPGADEESWAEECGGVLNTGIRVWLLPLLEEHDFHLYMAGHVHLYERTMVGNILHVIGGGGGGGLEECETPSPVSTLFVRHFFLRGLVGCDSLRLEAVGLDGEVFDWVELGAGEPGNIIDQGPGPNP